MVNIDLTSVLVGLMTLLGGCAWLVNWRKDRQEAKGLKADNRQKEMNLSKDYVTEFKTFIAEPLQREVSELRDEIAQLRYAIQKIDLCPHRANCPVTGELQREPQGQSAALGAED